MTPLQIAGIILGSLATLGIAAGGLGYLVSTFKKGEKVEKSDIVSSAEQLTQFWKDQADGYKTMMAEKDAKTAEQINALSREVGELKGQLISESKQKAEYLAILQNRDPDTKNFNDYVMQSIKNQEGINNEIVRILKEIHTMSTEETKRELHIEGTVTKQAQ
jgi:hypothetical protein